MSGRLCLVCVSLLCLLVALVGWSWSPVALGFCPGLSCVFFLLMVAVLRYEGADPRTGRFCQVPPTITVFCIRASPCFCSSYVLGRFFTQEHHADVYGRHPGGTLRERRARARHPRFFAFATKFFISSRFTDAILHQRGIADFLWKSISASSVGLDVVVAASSLTF